MTDYNNGKWHGWNGGECPVHPLTKINGLEPGGTHWTAKAEDCEWGSFKGAFRVIEEHKEPREFWVVKSWYSTGAWDTAREAAKDAEGCNGEVIHVREVIQ